MEQYFERCGGFAALENFLADPMSCGRILCKISPFSPHRFRNAQ